MADIRHYPLARHLRGTPALHVRHVRRGTVVHDGAGLSFFFRPLSAVLSEVPVDDRELAVLFHASTADFQDLTVQASLTFRIADPAVACSRLDFSIDPDTGSWRGTPLDQLAGLLTETAQQQVIGLIATRPLATVLSGGVQEVADRIVAGLPSDIRLAETGIAVIGARVVAIRPEPEVEKALRTPAREQIQQESDRATYERRAVAVQRERAIAENELANQIELAKREAELIAQKGANARRAAGEDALAAGIQQTAKANGELTLARARATGTQAIGEAKAAAEAAHVRAYSELPAASVLALAVQELAGQLPQIGSLVISPDLLAPVLARLGGQQAQQPGVSS